MRGFEHGRTQIGLQMLKEIRDHLGVVTLFLLPNQEGLGLR